MAKPVEPTVLAYGMREVSHGKWEAFRAHVPLSAIEALTPVHKVALMEDQWHKEKVPDHREPDNPRALLTKTVLGPMPTGKWETKRGERQDLAEYRMREAQRLEQQLGIRKPEPKSKSKSNGRAA